MKYGAHVIVRMKESFEKFFKYFCSDEELMYNIRINAEWNEESFMKMEQLKKLCNEFVYSLGK